MGGGFIFSVTVKFPVTKPDYSTGKIVLVLVRVMAQISCLSSLIIVSPLFLYNSTKYSY